MTARSECPSAAFVPQCTIDFGHVGSAMHALMAELFPICRSITGAGLRQSLEIIRRYLPLNLHEVATGTQAFDWTVPKEWTIREAYVLDPTGTRIVDFQRSNLHVVGYSVPVDLTMTLDELQPHLYSLPEQPEAIPYVTSYYRPHWGFCLPHRQRESLIPGRYRVVIDSELTDGALTYGEMVIPGASREEIFLSTYICHPSMANNELSGPVVATALGQWIASQQRRYTYRFVFIPETIGSLTYLSRNLELLKRNVVAGFNLTCLGDERTYSFLPSRRGNSLADLAALCILRDQHPDFIQYSYLKRGSDERQYCSPGVDLPIASVMRSKYGEYPEYHTSLDDLEFVTPSGLEGGYCVLRDCLNLLERNRVYRTTRIGEPQLGKYGLYPSVGTRETHRHVRDMMNLLAYCDGQNDLIDIANIIQVPAWRLYELVDRLLAEGLLIEASP